MNLKAVIAAFLVIMFPGICFAQQAGRASVNVNSDPAGAALYLDGMPVGNTPVSLKDVAPGEHTLKLTKDGYTETETKVTINPGDARNIKVAMEELPDTREKRLRYQSAMDRYETSMEEYRAISGPKKAWGWSLFGVGVAGLGAAGTLIGIGLSNASAAYNKYDQTVDQKKMNDYWSQVQSGENLSYWGYGTAGVSVVLIATSFYFLFTIPKTPKEPKPYTLFIPEPNVTPGSATLTWKGSF